MVAALQAAWSAITTADTGEGLPADHLSRGLDAAVRARQRHRHRCGDRGRTARRGIRRVGGAADWRRLLHGWPGLAARDLVALVSRIIKADSDFPRLSRRAIIARHPYDDGVWLGDAAALLAPPKGVDAIVSLCRVHDDDLPAGVEQIDVRLIDREGAEANLNLDFVLADTVRMIEQLRAEGRTVLVHCFGAYSRTPTIGAPVRRTRSRRQRANGAGRRARGVTGRGPEPSFSPSAESSGAVTGRPAVAFWKPWTPCMHFWWLIFPLGGMIGGGVQGDRRGQRAARRPQARAVPDQAADEDRRGGGVGAGQGRRGRGATRADEARRISTTAPTHAGWTTRWTSRSCSTSR